MALAKGRSAVCTGPVTLHTQTAIHIAQLMTQVTCPKPTPLPQFPLISVVFSALFPTPVFPALTPSIQSAHGTRLFSCFYIVLLSFVLLLFVVLQVMESQWEPWDVWTLHYVCLPASLKLIFRLFSSHSAVFGQYTRMTYTEVFRLLVKLCASAICKVSFKPRLSVLDFV